MPITAFNELLSILAGMGKSLSQDTSEEKAIIERCQDLMQSNSEVANLVRAQKILSQYKTLDDTEKQQFFQDITNLFGIDEDALEAEVIKWLDDKTSVPTRQLHFLSEPSSQTLLRTLNYAPNATLDLVNMRRDLLTFTKHNPALKSLDKDFLHMFLSWFNRGFLELKRIDWSTPADTLEKLIAYEAVHKIKGWDDLRQRVGDLDRGLYAYFHPALGNEPLIFVQVALMNTIPASITSILHAEREIIEPADANTAVFYSISNCQEGLKGVSFGNFLIKQVVSNISQEFPSLENFVTLSPIPGFRKWAMAQLDNPDSILTPQELNTIEDLSILDTAGDMDETKARSLQPSIAKYLVLSRSPKGGALDPVARFHLGNGAELYNIHPMADTTENGIQNAWGYMVNYKYNVAQIETNHDAYYNDERIATSDIVMQMTQQ